ncbi:MAG: ribonuclease HII [Candidatus Niyogibacteria bacterium]|nr:ribonuclease HII [Candidatus Niyogibacteria bacterium]
MAQRVKYIIGVDEAGRGPLAGPVAVAAILIPVGARVPDGVRDSKTLSASRRERLRGELRALFPSCVAMVGAATIDRIGISRAVRLATFRAIRRLTWKSDFQVADCEVLLDGLLKAPAEFKQKTVIHGDSIVPAISAASIIAKTARDRRMLALHKQFPQYGFDRHMGYGTAAHYVALKKHGLSPLHRKGYCATFLA